MTHTNHRFKLEPLKNDDFVVMAMPARGLNDGAEAAPKLKIILDIYVKNGALNGGGVNSGLLFFDGPEAVRRGISRDTPMLHGVFGNEESVRQVVRELKEKDLGISIILSGPISVVKQIASEEGIIPHSIAVAAGILGNTSLLPPDPIMEIATMCGHGLAHRNLIIYLVKKITKGKCSVEDAVNVLTKQCVCGVLNPTRTRRILQELVEQEVKMG